MCHHPAAQLFTWFAMNVVTGKNDWLCITCKACHEVIKGDTDEYEAYVHTHETKSAS